MNNSTPNTSAEPSTLQSQTCPRCGAAFTCGLANRQERCWCFDLPHVRLHPEPNEKGCLCPACLQGAIDDTLNRA
jgi:hypothetical protein